MYVFISTVDLMYLCAYAVRTSAPFVQLQLKQNLIRKLNKKKEILST